LHQLEVGFEKIEGRELVAVGPLYVAKYTILDFAPEVANYVEAKLDRAAVLVLMLNARDLFPNFRVDAQFLIQFTPQGIPRLFTRFNLASGKLPLQGHGLVPRTLANQDSALIHNQGSDHAFHE
jgi:hypothetical protein